MNQDERKSAFTMKVAKRQVSVVIPTRNRATLLRQALASVRALDGPDLDLDLIVADNGLGNDTEVAAREFGARLVPAPGQGASAARNAGLRAATGEFIAFLDDDDLWLSGHLRPHLELLAARPDLDAVVGQVINTDHLLKQHSSPWPATLPLDGDLLLSFLRSSPQIGATVVRAAVLDSVGGFDERLASSEDWDWHLRLAMRHQIGFVAEPCALFRQWPSGSKDEVQWKRFPYLSRVFWANVRQAGTRRPPAYVLLRAYLQHRGRFAAQLIQSAAGHVVQRDHAAARRAVVWALRISPIHAVLAIARLLIARSDDQMVLRLRAVPATHADDARVSAKEG
jgi:glycosyltransferase involved in cell wall biosynthesis